MVSRAAKGVPSRVLGAVALCSVLYLWSYFLHRLLGSETRPFSIGLLVAVALLSLAFRFALAGKESMARRITSILLALALSYTAPLAIGQRAGEISLVSITVFFTCVFSLDLGRRDWDYTDARRLMSRTSVFLGLVVFASSVLRHTYQLPYVLLYLVTIFLTVNFARDLDVNTQVKSVGKSYSGVVAGVTLALLLLLFGFLSTGLLFGFSSIIATVGGWIREIIILLLYPIGFIAHGLVLFFRFLIRNKKPEEPLPLEPMEGATEELTKQVTALSHISDLQIAYIVIALALVAAYLLLRPSRKKEHTEVYEERESLLPQALADVKFRLPRLRSRGRVALSENPKDIFQVFAWLEHWGKALGRPRRREETVTEYSSALEKRLTPADVREVSASFEQVKYGDASLTSGQWQRVLAAWERLKKHSDR